MRGRAYSDVQYFSAILTFLLLAGGRVDLSLSTIILYGWKYFCCLLYEKRSVRVLLYDLLLRTRYDFSIFLVLIHPPLATMKNKLLFT